MMTRNERTVTVERVRLITKLKENLEKHMKDYDEAKAGYRIKLKVDLEAALSRFAGASYNELCKISVPNNPPVNYIKEYEDAIEMLTWSSDEKITLDQVTFKQYVQDEWGWKQAFEITNTAYKSFTAGASLS